MKFMEIRATGVDALQREEITTRAGTYIGIWTWRDEREILVAAFLGPEAQHRCKEWAAGQQVTMTKSKTGTLRRVTDAYFAGRRDAFSMLSIGFLTGTLFQVEIWKALARVPYGKTYSYAQLAASIGRAKSARPTGQAVGANPIPLVIPCHRIVGSQGEMTGFGCGLPVKRVLLKAEGWSLDHRDRLLEPAARAQSKLL